MEYSKKSLIDVKGVSLAPGETKQYRFEFEPGKINNTSILYKYGVTGDLKTRYSGKYQIVFTFQYYNEALDNQGKMVYSPGQCHTITSIPYMQRELNEMKAVGEEELHLENKSIKSIQVSLINNSSSNISVNYVDLLMALFDTSDMLIIPLIEDIETIKDKPEGSLWRCEWIEGRDY